MTEGDRVEAVFVSDVHLSPAHPATTRAFLRFLERHVAGKAERLYILGDLFEYWAGDDVIDSPFNRTIVDVLRGLVESGTELFFIAGNRDLLIGDGFARATGARLLPDPSPIRFEDRLGGRSMLVSHGDELCTDDAAYQAFRAMVRDPEWQRAFLAKPLEERTRIIGSMRMQSEIAKKEKIAEIMDVNADAVADLFERSGETVLVHGHTHRPARHSLTVCGRTCERWVLPDWDAEATPPRGGGLVLDDEGLREISPD